MPDNTKPSPETTNKNEDMEVTMSDEVDAIDHTIQPAPTPESSAPSQGETAPVPDSNIERPDLVQREGGATPEKPAGDQSSTARPSPTGQKTRPKARPPQAEPEKEEVVIPPPPREGQKAIEKIDESIPDRAKSGTKAGRPKDSRRAAPNPQTTVDDSDGDDAGLIVDVDLPGQSSGDFSVGNTTASDIPTGGEGATPEGVATSAVADLDAVLEELGIDDDPEADVVTVEKAGVSRKMPTPQFFVYVQNHLRAITTHFDAATLIDVVAVNFLARCRTRGILGPVRAVWQKAGTQNGDLNGLWQDKAPFSDLAREARSFAADITSLFNVGTVSVIIDAVSARGASTVFGGVMDAGRTAHGQVAAAVEARANARVITQAQAALAKDSLTALPWLWDFFFSAMGWVTGHIPTFASVVLGPLTPTIDEVAALYACGLFSTKASAASIESALADVGAAATGGRGPGQGDREAASARRAERSAIGGTTARAYLQQNGIIVTGVVGAVQVLCASLSDTAVDLEVLHTAYLEALGGYFTDNQLLALIAAYPQLVLVKPTRRPAIRGTTATILVLLQKQLASFMSWVTNNPFFVTVSAEQYRGYFVTSYIRTAEDNSSKMALAICVPRLGEDSTVSALVLEPLLKPRAGTSEMIAIPLAGSALSAFTDSTVVTALAGHVSHELEHGGVARYSTINPSKYAEKWKSGPRLWTLTTDNELRLLGIATANSWMVQDGKVLVNLRTGRSFKLAWISANPAVMAEQWAIDAGLAVVAAADVNTPPSKTGAFKLETAFDVLAGLKSRTALPNSATTSFPAPGPLRVPGQFVKQPVLIPYEDAVRFVTGTISTHAGKLQLRAAASFAARMRSRIESRMCTLFSEMASLALPSGVVEYGISGVAAPLTGNPPLHDAVPAGEALDDEIGVAYVQEVWDRVLGDSTLSTIVVSPDTRVFAARTETEYVAALVAALAYHRSILAAYGVDHMSPIIKATTIIKVANDILRRLPPVNDNHVATWR